MTISNEQLSVQINNVINRRICFLCHQITKTPNSTKKNCTDFINILSEI